MDKMRNTRILTASAMLLAIAVILGFFKIPVNQFMELRFAFLPIACTGMLFGPFVGGVVGALSDILGYLAKPTGPYFPGFTLSCALTGVIFGLLLKGGKPFKSVVLAAAADQVIVGLLMNTFWISLLYGSPFLQLMEIRSIQAAIMFVLETVVIRLMDVPMKKAAEYCYE